MCGVRLFWTEDVLWIPVVLGGQPDALDLVAIKATADKLLRLGYDALNLADVRRDALHVFGRRLGVEIVIEAGVPSPEEAAVAFREYRRVTMGFWYPSEPLPELRA